MAKSIERHPKWDTMLAPRLVLGLWHPKYLEPAQRLLPLLKRAHIGVSPSHAKKYFWSGCTAFSMQFSSLVGREGESFRQACKRDGKELLVWTVNKRNEMIEATKWGAKAVLTDKTADFLSLRQQMRGPSRSPFPTMHSLTMDASRRLDEGQQGDDGAVLVDVGLLLQPCPVGQQRVLHLRPRPSRRSRVRSHFADLRRQSRSAGPWQVPEYDVVAGPAHIPPAKSVVAAS